MKRGRVVLLCAVLALWATPRGYAADAGAAPTVAASYPGLVTGVLAYARLAELPTGVLLRAGKTEIAAKDLEDVLAKSPKAVREQLRKNALFLLEDFTTEKLLLSAATEAAAKASQDIAGKADREVIAGYLKGLAAQVKVTEAEIAEFYEKNREACGGAKLEKVKPQIETLLLEEKQQDAVARHVEGIAKASPMAVSASWAKEQAELARDNPVDKARASGKPSMVDFGADGCRPCDMMAPILKTLKKKYEGRANVLFVHVRTEQILAARYGVRSIPVQVFFDKDGKEVSRHVGFFPQDEIEKTLGEMGVN